VKIGSNVALQEKVCLLLDALIDSKVNPPDGCLRWKSIEELEAALSSAESA